MCILNQKRTVKKHHHEDLLRMTKSNSWSISKRRSGKELLKVKHPYLHNFMNISQIFPEVMHLELREFAEDVLESEPENGAAVIMLTIIVWESKNVRYGESDKDLTFLENAMVTAPNDPETCFFAASKYDEYFDPLFCSSLTALERLFERSMQQDESELYGWLVKLYNEIGRTPCYIYRSLMRNPDANTELISRCMPLITKMQHAFQDKLSDVPDDWYALRGLGDIYQTLGETELSKKISVGRS